MLFLFQQRLTSVLPDPVKMVGTARTKRTIFDATVQSNGLEKIVQLVGTIYYLLLLLITLLCYTVRKRFLLRKSSILIL